MTAHPHIPLDELRQQVAACHACPLANGRTQTVFGDGNPDARVLIVGEAPGKNEDLQGVPFVGAAGQQLNRLLEIAGLKREDVFIANVLKCRPPGNRDPRPEEIEVCTPFLREQTRTIDPEFIVTLGNFATKFILKTEMGITRLHGELQMAGRRQPSTTARRWPRSKTTSSRSASFWARGRKRCRPSPNPSPNPKLRLRPNPTS